MERVDIIGLYLIESPGDELEAKEMEMAREIEADAMPTHLRL